MQYCLKITQSWHERITRCNVQKCSVYHREAILALTISHIWPMSLCSTSKTEPRKATLTEKKKRNFRQVWVFLSKNDPFNYLSNTRAIFIVMSDGALLIHAAVCIYHFVKVMSSGWKKTYNCFIVWNWTKQRLRLALKLIDNNVSELSKLGQFYMSERTAL